LFVVGAFAPKSAAGRVRFVDALRVRTFAVLYLAETQSIIGDQLARVALSILVFTRTGSISATAATYAATFLPAIAGGALLSELSDRLPRRTVMIACDALRALFFAGMALPATPLWAMFVLVVLAVLLGPLFVSAEVSLLAAVLSETEYRAATGLRLITSQIAQVAGFAVGGVVVAVLHARWALAADALSFALSAGLIAVAMPRTRSAMEAARTPTVRVSFLAATKVLFGTRRIGALVALCWLAGFFIAPEGLAVPYAEQLHVHTAEVGILFAAIPFGSVVGAWFVVRLSADVRRRNVAVVMAVLTGIPLLVCALEPGLFWTVVLWVLSGLFAAYQVEIIPTVVQQLPDALRGRTIGVLGAGLTSVQGIGVVVFGAVGDAIGAAGSVALAGGVGSAVALLLGMLVSTRAAGDPATQQDLTGAAEARTTTDVATPEADTTNAPP
jgi:predicted MFS family arabinose efflux permease